MAQTRKLAAILAADVVGYSRLASADEEGTVARLRALRHELIDPVIGSNNGRTIKTTGDGRLIEFASVVDALRCAIEVQRKMTVRAEPGFRCRLFLEMGLDPPIAEKFVHALRELGLPE
jgi:adenylate cyclase